MDLAHRSVRSGSPSGRTRSSRRQCQAAQGPAGGLDALRTSELRVAQLAAEGRSNKEIAQALFVTVKTVEVHLSSTYRKLEIGSRAQLEKALVAAAPVDAAAVTT